MFSCFWRYDAGHEGFISSSTIFFTTSALSSPHAIRWIFFADSMVDIPIAIALSGVSCTFPAKFLDWRFLDVYGRRTVRVLPLSDAPASLKPIWPFSPVPIMRRSSPDALRSYSAQNSLTASLSSIWSSFGTCTFSGFTSICATRSS